MRINNFLLVLLGTLVYVNASSALAQKYVVKDGDVTISYDEMQFLVTRWTPQMRDVALQDQGDRLELINLSLANKKVAAQADQLAKDNPDIYWDYEAGLRAYKRDYMLRHFQDNIEYPDFTELALEEYNVKKNKVALNPEKRLSSHILFASPPGLPRDDVMVKAQGVLDELLAGADFVEMVTKYSEEPGAAAKKGLFNRWMTFGDKDVSPPYSKGVFEIEKVGDYGGLVNTQFGVHIIRLDGIQEATYKPFDEVKEQLIAKYKNDYRQLALKDFVAQFHMGDDVIIDDEAIDKILAPYKTGE